MSGSSPPVSSRIRAPRRRHSVGVLGVLVLPERELLRPPVDDQLRAHPPAELGLLRRGDDAHRDRPAVERELGGVGTETAGGAPDQHHVALRHAGAVARHQLPVGGGVDQPGAGRLLPGQVGGLGHQLVGLDQRHLGEAAEVRLEAPDPLLRVEHGVVVALGALQLHAQAVRDDLVPGLPGVHPGPGTEHHAGQVGAHLVVGQVVASAERRQPAVALEEAEGRHRLEDRGPDRVVVDRAGHHRHQRLARPELRHRHLVDVQRLARVLVGGRAALEHARLVLADADRPVRLRHRQGRDVVAGGVAGQDRVQDLLHRGPLAWRGGAAGGYRPVTLSGTRL